MSFFDSLITPQSTPTPKTPVQSGGGFLNNVTSTQAPSQPQVAPAPVIQDVFGKTAQSTTPVAKPGTPDITDYLFNPKAETKIQPLGFTKEQAPTFTGPRAIFGPTKIITDFFTDFIKGATQATSDVSKLIASKNSPANNTKVPNQVAEGFLPEGGTDMSGKILSVAQRTAKRQKELDADTPTTTGLNAAQAMFEVGVPATFNLLFAEDIAKNVTQSFLKNTGFQSALGLKYSSLANLPAEDFVKTVSSRTREAVTGIAEDLKAGKITQKMAEDRMAQIGTEYQNLADIYKKQDSVHLNNLGRLFENTSIALNEDVSQLGKRDYSPVEGAVRPAEKTLPGSRPVPGQAPAFGLSTQAVENVGGEAPKGGFFDKMVKPEEVNAIENSQGKPQNTLETSLVKSNVQEPKPPVYEGEKDLTVKTLEKLAGRSTVSKTFIDNLTNQPDLKQQERDVVREALKDYPDGSQVPVAEFAKKVKAELLPLTTHEGEDPVHGTGGRYESISLPPESRGDVENYRENIYSSPIKTSAGDTHFSGETDSYFGHTRVEDMAVSPKDIVKERVTLPDGSVEIRNSGGGTRRVIEVQSDLYQKGKLSREGNIDSDPISHLPLEEQKEFKYLAKKVFDIAGAVNKSSFDNEIPQMEKRLDVLRDKAFKLREEAQTARTKETSKLQQYNDPTAHFRMAREEIKKASEDGKTKLQFPTGETAMKIEGLGQRDTWVEIKNGKRSGEALETSDLKVGKEINQIGQGDSWIITDVLGDGKFKAVPKKVYDHLQLQKGGYEKAHVEEQFNNLQESFDISEKIDTSNPIYKFYEKDLGKYLASKYGAVRVTDKQGVSWYEVPVSKDVARKPVEAFSRSFIGQEKKPLTLGKNTLPREEIKAIIFKDIPKDQVRLIFRDGLVDGQAFGKYTGTWSGLKGVLKPMIELAEVDGKSRITTAYHESGHYIFDNFLDESDKAAVLKLAEKELGPITKTAYKALGYKGKETILEEYVMDKYADYKANEAGYKGSPYISFFRKLDAIIQKIKDLYKKFKGNLNAFFEERGGSEGGYANFNEDLPKKTPLGKSVGKVTVGGKEIDVTKGGKMEIPVQKLSNGIKEVFDNMKTMSKGFSISNPDGLVKSGLSINKNIADVIGIPAGEANFTRRSLKHLSEKGELGEKLLESAPKILTNPTDIREGNGPGRFIITSDIKNTQENPKTALSLEVKKVGNNIIVTVFPTDDKYLEPFAVLWRAADPVKGIPPYSDHTPKSGTSSLSGSKAPQNPQAKTFPLSKTEGQKPQISLESPRSLSSKQPSLNQNSLGKKATSLPSRAEAPATSLPTPPRQGSQAPTKADTLKFSYADSLAKPQTEVKQIDKIIPNKIELPADMQKRQASIEVQKEALKDNPLGKLQKYVAKSGEFQGKLPELGMGKSTFSKSGDAIVQDIFNDANRSAKTAVDVEQVRSDFEDFTDRKKEVALADKQLKKEIKEFEATAPGIAAMEKVKALRKDIFALESTGLDATKQRADVRKLVLGNKTSLTPLGTPLKTDQSGIPIALTERQKNIVANSKFRDTPEPTAPPFEGSYGEVKVTEILARQAESIVHGSDIPPDVSMRELIEKTVTPVQKTVNHIDTYLRTPDRVMEKIGFGEEAKDLRRAMDSYWKELPKNLEKIGEWAKAVPAKSNIRIFKFLDGQAIDLTPDEHLVASEVKTWLREWADRLGLAQDDRVTDYITRIFDNGQSPAMFDEDLAKIIADKVPGSVYNPFTLRRLGAKGYRQDTWKALEAYVKRGTRKVHLDPVLERIQARTGQELATTPLEESQYKYIQKYIHNINMRPSDVDKGWDNLIKTIFTNKTVAKIYAGARKASFGILPEIGQRPVTSILRFLRQMTSRAMLGLNPGSALRNLSQGVNTYAVLGEKYTVIGYAKMLKRGAMEELNNEGVLNASFIQDKQLSATKKALEKIDKMLYSFFEMAERINRGSAYFGAKSKALDAGKTEEEAVEYAKDIVRKTQFSFDSVDTPVGMGSDIVKTLLQFQTYTTKQTEFILGLAKDKNFLGLLRYAVAGMVFVYTVGKAFGMKPQELIPAFRFGAPPSWTIPIAVGGAIANVPDKYGNTLPLGKRAQNVGSAVLKAGVPAGTQINKTYQGYKAVQAGASLDAAGRKQFSVGGSLGKNIQSLAFGKYANSAADDHFNGITPAERAYSDLSKSKTPKADLLNLAKKDPALVKQVLAIVKKRAAGITPEDDKVLNMGVASGQRARYVADKLNKLKTNQEKKAFLLLEVKKKIVTKEVLPQVLGLMKK